MIPELFLTSNPPKISSNFEIYYTNRLDWEIKGGEENLLLFGLEQSKKESFSLTRMNSNRSVSIFTYTSATCWWNICMPFVLSHTIISDTPKRRMSEKFLKPSAELFFALQYYVSSIKFSADHKYRHFIDCRSIVSSFVLVDWRFISLYNIYSLYRSAFFRDCEMLKVLLFTSRHCKATRFACSRYNQSCSRVDLDGPQAARVVREPPKVFIPSSIDWSWRPISSTGKIQIEALLCVPSRDSYRYSFKESGRHSVSFSSGTYDISRVVALGPTLWK